MPNTYSLISSNVLTASAGSVSFNSIPATFTDLLLRYSTKTDYADFRVLGAIRFNNDTANNYSNTTLNKVDNTVQSNRYSSNSFSYDIESPSASGTANTFGSGEIYVPSYLVAANKPFSDITYGEINTGLNQQIYALANLWRNTAAITSITAFPGGGANFVSGSSFYLYGIKNS
jgi:hypothetical protein